MRQRVRYTVAGLSLTMTDTQAVSRRVGSASLLAVVATHLLWDPALTLLGVAEFGIAEEDTAVVRMLLAFHPAAWLGVKLAVVSGFTAVVIWLDAHRILATTVLLWFVALLGFVAPLGWLELLVANR